MKKLLTAVLILCLIISMVQMATADDRLKLRGSIRLRTFNLDNETDRDRSLNDRYLDGFDNVAKYIDSRFRFGMEITLAEGVTANLRMDLHDDNIWGGKDINTDGGLGRPLEGGSTIEIDRMYIRVEKEKFIYQGGQIFQTFGVPDSTTAYGPQNMGMALRLKLPVIIDLNYFKLKEAGSELDAEEGELEVFDAADSEKDTNQYGIQAQYKSDIFVFGAYYGKVKNTSEIEYDPSVIGLWATAKIGPANVIATVDRFGGSKDEEQLYTGTQAWLNGETAATETVTIGLNLYYATAGDEDGTEVQLTSLPEKYGGFEPHEYGLQTLDDGLDPAGNNTPFDPEKLGAGTIGADIYTNVEVIKNVFFAAQVGYAMPQDKDVAVNTSLNDALWENSIYFEGSVRYQFAPNCDLLGAAYYRSVSYEDEDTEDPYGLAAMLEIIW